VLDGLRHDAIVGGHYNHGEIDAADAGEHVAHEPFVTGNVDKADERPARGRPVREAEIDGDAARFFLRQTIGVDAVMAPTSRVLPWSMWPAVATIIGR